jgi:hypothetical protein
MKLNATGRHESRRNRRGSCAWDFSSGLELGPELGHELGCGYVRVALGVDVCGSQVLLRSGGQGPLRLRRGLWLTLLNAE